MDLGIEGRLAIVTGGSSGLGYGVAETLAEEGVRLLLFARDAGRLQVARERLARRFAGVEVATVAGDMTEKDDVARLAMEARTRGGPDILILNTGRPPSPMRDLLDETDSERWDRGYRDQLAGGINVLLAITPLLVARGWGRIVAITSASVKQPLPKHAISTVFRAGLTAALKHLANETAGTGITINIVCPASIASDAFAANHDVTERLARVPLARLGTVAELAGAVAFFASERAGFIHGTSLQVDGGMTASLY